MWRDKAAVHVVAARALLDGEEHAPAQPKRARCDGSGLAEREAAAAHSDGGSEGSSNGGGGSSNGGGGLGSGGEGGAGQGGEVAAGSEATGRATPDRRRRVTFTRVGRPLPAVPNVSATNLGPCTFVVVVVDRVLFEPSTIG